MPKVIIIGAGVSGLFAAYRLLQHHISVELYDQNAIAGVKWLLAGASGLNLSASYPKEQMKDFYGEAAPFFDQWLNVFSPEELGQFVTELGGSLEKGSAHRLLEKKLGAKEMLNRWWQKLIQEESFSFFPHHRFLSFKQEESTLLLEIENTEKAHRFWISGDAVLFACGGASYPQTGSDGKWKKAFEAHSLPITPFAPSNCNFSVCWSKRLFPSIKGRIQYRYLKNVALGVEAEKEKVRGDLVLTPTGVEGLPLYRHSAFLRKKIQTEGKAVVFIDLFPDLTIEQIQKRVRNPIRKKTLSHYFHSTLSLSKEGFSLLMESLPASLLKLFRESPIKKETLQHLKSIPLTLVGIGTLAKAISTAGGVPLNAVTEKLMLSQQAGFFVCGEMVDWEAPTGGFLMQGCFTTASVATEGILEWLDKQ